MPPAQHALDTLRITGCYGLASGGIASLVGHRHAKPARGDATEDWVFFAFDRLRSRSRLCRWRFRVRRDWGPSGARKGGVLDKKARTVR